MPKPSMPNIPGMNAMTDTLDFVKNLWGGMNIPGMNLPNRSIPGMVMPTLSVEEINKQISDLKAVESWLTLNMNMLRGTIQALEVQSATISTLKSMSDALSVAVAPTVAKNAAPDSASAPKGSSDSNSRPTEKPGDGAQSANAIPPQSKAGPNAGAAKESEAQLGNPAIWWNMLQDQFKQAVNAAMASEQREPAAKPKAAEVKPAPKKTPAARKRQPVVKNGEK